MAEIETKVNEKDEKVDEKAVDQGQVDDQQTDETADEQVLSEAEIAAQTLADAERPPVEAVADQRAKKQEAQAVVADLKTDMAVQIATLTGKIDALTQMKAPAAEQKTVEKSPVDLYIEKNGEEVPIDGKTYRAQQQWEADQATAAETASAEDVATESKKLVTTAQQEFSAEKVGVGMDFNTIVETGQSFLSDDDRLAVAQAAPADRCKILYDRSVAALKESPLVKSLITSIAAGTKENADKGGQQETGEKKTDEKTPTQDEVLDEPVDAVTQNAMGWKK